MRKTPRPLRTVALSALASTLVACGSGEPTSAGTGDPGIRIVAGAGVSDTIGTQFGQALIVEVRRPDGSLARNAIVRFEAVRPVDSTRRSESAIHVCTLTAPFCGGFRGVSTFVADTTDNQGRAEAIIRLGSVAGTAYVRMSAPEFGFVDSASFGVRVGAPARVMAALTTVTLNIGFNTPILAAVTDRDGNPRPERVSFSTEGGAALRIEATTGTATALELGRQAIIARYSTFADTVTATLVPAGRLLVWNSRDAEVRLINTDGSGIRVLIAGISTDFGVFPSFDSSRGWIAMQRATVPFPAVSNSIVVIDTTGGSRRDIGPLPQLGTIMAQRRMIDGTIRIVAFGTDGVLWSVAPDSTVTRIASIPNLVATYGGADISSDGHRVAFVAPSTIRGQVDLRVLDVRTGAVTPIATRARSPRWSPTDSELAYLAGGDGFDSLDGRVTVASADGATKRTLGFVVHVPGLAWSPDGAYLVGRSAAGLRITRVRDGEGVQLEISEPSGRFADYYQPDWR